MDLLIQEQKVLYGELEKFHKNVKKAPIDRKQSKGYIEGRLAGLKDLWKEFEQNNKKILMVYTNLDQTKDYFANDVFTETENAYYDLLGMLTDMLGLINHVPLEDMATPQRRRERSPPQLKLPPIKIPTFDGSYHAWLPFKELFEAIVDKDEHLSYVQKLHYLKSSLDGDAAKLIQHLNIVGANYAPAWEMLVNRYNNKRILVNTQLKALMNLPVQKNETAEGLRGLLDGAMECFQSLNTIGIVIRTWDPILIHILAEKLTYETHSKWESSLSEKDVDELPTLMEFKKFLENRFRTLEAMAQSSSKPPSENRVSHISHSAQTRRSFHTSSKERKCSLCQSNHYLIHCEKFKDLNVTDRLSWVSKAALCFNCLVPGHCSRDCTSSYRCKICNHKHHSSIHPDAQSSPPSL